MLKIASPQELQAEIRAIMAFVHASEKPDRLAVASKLNELADRVAGVKKEKIPESERDSWKDSIRRNKGRYHGPNGLKSGQKYKHQGKDWLIMDFDADSKAPGGSTLILVSPDFKETVRGVEVEGKSKTAAAPSKGQKDKVKYHGEDDVTFKVLRVFPTKDDADGPLPRDLLRLIKKGGGAALVELLPSGDYKVKGDMLVSPDSSKPRHYIRAFGPSGSWDGFPVALKPPQLKRLHSYRESSIRELIHRLAARAEVTDYDRIAAAKSIGRAEVLGMKFGTRYKYDFGIFIDYVEKEDTFHVNQAGRPTKKLGKAKTLKDAEKIATKKGDLNWSVAGAKKPDTEAQVEAILRKTKLKPSAKRFAPNGAGSVVFEDSKFTTGGGGVQAEKDAKQLKKLLDKAGLKTDLQELRGVGKWRINIKPA